MFLKHEENADLGAEESPLNWFKFRKVYSLWCGSFGLNYSFVGYSSEGIVDNETSLTKFINDVWQWQWQSILIWRRAKMKSDYSRENAIGRNRYLNKWPAIWIKSVWIVAGSLESIKEQCFQSQLLSGYLWMPSSFTHFLVFCQRIAKS